MNYNYIIKDEKIYEFEGQQISYDGFGHTIKFLVENVEKNAGFSDLGKRKLKWLKKNHPEFFI
jgi:hypothetical protein